MSICGMMLAITSQLLDSEEVIVEIKPARDEKDFLMTSLSLIAAAIFMTGIWGIGTYKIRHRLYVMLFGLFSNGVTIAMAGCAAIFAGLKDLNEETMDSFCPGNEPKDNQFELFADIGTFMQQIDDLNALSSFYMCSTTCPCAQQSAETVASWTPEQNWNDLGYEDSSDYELFW